MFTHYQHLHRTKELIKVNTVERSIRTKHTKILRLYTITNCYISLQRSTQAIYI